ncbi:MAG TPA: TatD family hydrolase, partial [Candidatus Butyricimonas faecavium]|nr:TatD family hydrolase [Candidatus Butyricimonas faecavium]
SGFFFSINSAMIQSDNGRKIIAEIPKELILTETDFPYIENDDITSIYVWLSKLWNTTTKDVELTIDANFQRLIRRIK